MQGRLEPGAKDGVDEEIGLAEQLDELIVADALVDLGDHLVRGGFAQLVQRLRGRAFHVPLRAGEQDAHADAFRRQEPGRDEAIAAVVALAAHDHDARGERILAQAEGGDGLAGALHELGEGNARRRGTVVGGLHFCGGKDLHTLNR